MYTVKDAITNLLEEIEDKQQQIKQLQQFDKFAKRGLTEQEYHNFCDTDLRYSDVLGKALLIVFPFLEFEKRGANWFFYLSKEENVQICIPNSRCLGVDVVIPDLIPNIDKRIHSIEQKYWFQTRTLEKKIQLHKDYLQADTITKRAKLMFPTYRMPFAVMKLFLLGKQASVKEMQKKTEETEAELNKIQDKISKEVAEATELYYRQKAFLDKYIPAFLKWTIKTVRVQTALDSCIGITYQYKDGELKIQ